MILKQVDNEICVFIYSHPYILSSYECHIVNHVQIVKYNHKISKCVNSNIYKYPSNGQ